MREVPEKPEPPKDPPPVIPPKSREAKSAPRLMKTTPVSRLPQEEPAGGTAATVIKSPTAAEPGVARIEITEADLLKFQLTKAKEKILSIQESKLNSDEKVVALSRDLLKLQTEMNEKETLEIYKAIGIRTGDKVIDHDGTPVILRGIPPTGKPGGNGQT